jgi:hypothetical protein
MHGKDISIPKGHEVTVYTNSDYSIASAWVGTAAPKSGVTLTNAEVLKLKEAGLSEQLNLDKIKSTTSTFTLDTDDLLALKKVGLSGALISGMIQAQQRPQGK